METGSGHSVLWYTSRVVRSFPLVTSLLAVALTALVLLAAWVLLTPGGPLLRSASFSLENITPNADGDSDVTTIRYNLARPATVSIYFLDEAANRFTFRHFKPRESGEHEVLFSGIVDPFVRPEDEFPDQVLGRLMPDGEYAWVVEAFEDGKQPEKVTGTLNVSEADTTLPAIRNLSASPNPFSPNQDGLDDRAAVTLWLDTDVPEESGLRVTLISEDGQEFPIAEQASATLPGRAGLHTFDYDGGIDLGQEPPPDGVYIVRAEAEDAAGQKMRAATLLTIADSGLPRAEILNAEVRVSKASVVIGETLFFTLTVENYGTAPIRTFGPWPGAVYQQAENSNTLEFFEQDGAWRVGIDCDTCIRDYPWRWAVGRPEDLVQINGQWYLAPGQRAVVTGGIILKEIVPARNPQYFWAGLIHEAVEVAAVNNRVDPFYVTIVSP